jgi:hypothetical protein
MKFNAPWFRKFRPEVSEIKWLKVEEFYFVYAYSLLLPFNGKTSDCNGIPGDPEFIFNFKLLLR